MSTKRRRTSPDWSQLHLDVFESILNRLSFVDMIQCKGVCRSWRSHAHVLFSSHSPLSLLILPSNQEGDDDRRNCFFNLAEKKFYSLKNMPNNFGQSRCVGSSHGWLLLSNEKPDVYIFNPFSGLHAQIPFPESAILKLHDERLQIRYNISKVVLASDPIRSNNNYGVVAIYKFQSKIGFLKFGDSKWTDLEGRHRRYSDIICYNNHIYALADTGSVEVWDINNFAPKRKMDIEPSFPHNMVEFDQCCLVESLGDILLVVRYVSEFVGEHDRCSYMTRMFHIYKLDFNQKKWVALKSLGNRVLFLGGNHSVSLSAPDFPGSEENSIYFTDDNWIWMNEPEIGVFNLLDGQIKEIYLNLY